MIDRRTWLRIGAVAAVPFSLLSGYLWHSGFEPEYVAYGRISIPAAVAGTAIGPHGSLAPTLEEVLLSPENVTVAADLLRSRGVTLSTVSPLDSDVEELIRRLDAGHDQLPDHAEVRLSFQTPDAEQAIPVLTAVLDACLKALDQSRPKGDQAVAAGREAELRDLNEELSGREGALAELELQSKRPETATLDPSLIPERIKALETSLSSARDRRVAAEDRLADVHQQLGEGASAEQIADRIAGPEDPASVRDRLVTTRARERLKQQQEAFDRAATIYGRNHPRLIQLRNEVDQLKQETGVVQADSRDDAASLSPSAVLLRSQEELLSQATTAERELQEQLDQVVANQKLRKELEEQIALARDEIAPLRERRDEVARQIEVATIEAEASRATISEPPALAPEAIVPSLTGYLVWSGLAGLVLGAVLWRGSRKSPRFEQTMILLPGPKLPVVPDWERGSRKPAEQPVLHPEPPTLPAEAIDAVTLELTVAPAPAREPELPHDEPELPSRPRERYRSQEEENLARLKQLSMQTA